MITRDQAAKDLQCEDPAVRNRTALEVVENDYRELAPILLAQSLNRKNIGYNGTLVFALGHFDCSRYFPQLVEISITHDYEAAVGAMGIIDDQSLAPTRGELECASVIIERAKKDGLTEDQSEALKLIWSRYY